MIRPGVVPIFGGGGGEGLIEIGIGSDIICSIASARPGQARSEQSRSMCEEDRGGVGTLLLSLLLLFYTSMYIVQVFSCVLVRSLLSEASGSGSLVGWFFLPSHAPMPCASGTMYTEEHILTYNVYQVRMSTFVRLLETCKKKKVERRGRGGVLMHSCVVLLVRFDGGSQTIVGDEQGASKPLRLICDYFVPCM